MFSSSSSSSPANADIVKNRIEALKAKEKKFFILQQELAKLSLEIKKEHLEIRKLRYHDETEGKFKSLATLVAAKLGISLSDFNCVEDIVAKRIIIQIHYRDNDDKFMRFFQAISKNVEFKKGVNHLRSEIIFPEKDLPLFIEEANKIQSEDLASKSPANR